MEYFSTKNTNFDSLIYEITTNAKNVETENQSHFLSSMSYFIISKFYFFKIILKMAITEIFVQSAVP